MGRFDDVTVFVRAVEVGSFSSAAQELGIAKSIVSRRIVSLPNGRFGGLVFLVLAPFQTDWPDLNCSGRF